MKIQCVHSNEASKPVGMAKVFWPVQSCSTQAWHGTSHAASATRLCKKLSYKVITGEVLLTLTGYCFALLLCSS